MVVGFVAAGLRGLCAPTLFVGEPAIFGFLN